MAEYNNYEDPSNDDLMRAPRRFKTAFIFFSSARHKEMKEELASEGKAEKTTTIAKALSKEWREMSPADRAVWEAKSKIDKDRYDAEMATFKQHQKLHNTVPAKKAKKDPSAPKRPMSAFLAFSNQRRAALKRKNPDATNADLSKMLSVAWKEATDEFKAEFVEEEARLRAQYKIDILAWRKKKSDEIRSTIGGNRKAMQTAYKPDPSTRVKKGAAPLQQQQPPAVPNNNSALNNGGMYGLGNVTGFGHQQGMLNGMGGSQFMGSHFGQLQQQQPGSQQSFYNAGFQGNGLQGSSFQGATNPAMYQAFQMHPQFAMQTQQHMGGGPMNLYGGQQGGMPQGNYNYGLMGFSSGFDAYGGGADSNAMYLHQQQHPHDGH
ncbi:hypothetical protein FisN_29Hh110 [Fistulifera solaris]|uniref:HMG box domain-containing protein n=1 Tax=Fistulifera solaris TaxID=1519565 RepID=A0A1Z5K6F6_FISSO|nr:hypothetical protein FisN_29Hh110 [Fistulifera solaris]|eukprot:GAX21671.1 hypothetical protein FisN_29Hh110 [Fistulifera solaris]